jgi:hypothetical protein
MAWQHLLLRRLRPAGRRTRPALHTFNPNGSTVVIVHRNSCAQIFSQILFFNPVFYEDNT